MDGQGNLIGIIIDGDLWWYMEGLLIYCVGEVMICNLCSIVLQNLVEQVLYEMQLCKIISLFVLDVVWFVGLLYIYDFLCIGMVQVMLWFWIVVWFWVILLLVVLVLLLVLFLLGCKFMLDVMIFYVNVDLQDLVEWQVVINLIYIGVISNGL